MASLCEFGVAWQHVRTQGRDGRAGAVVLGKGGGGASIRASESDNKFAYFTGRRMCPVVCSQTRPLGERRVWLHFLRVRLLQPSLLVSFRFCSVFRREHVVLNVRGDRSRFRDPFL